jgi:hypothetical protein
VNDAPLAADQVVTLPEESSTNVVFAASDVDDTNLVFSIVSGPTNGALGNLNTSSGAVTYTPNASYFGPDGFTFSVFDGSLSATGTVSLNVLLVHQRPAFPVAPALQIIPEHSELVLTNAASDADTAAEVLLYQLTGPAGATITNLGIIRWTPDEGAGPSTNEFTTVVSDGLHAATNTFTVIVTEVNVAPVFLAAPPHLTVKRHSVLVVTNTATDGDLPTNWLDYALTLAPTNASITGNGVIHWTPDDTQAPSTNVFRTVVSDGFASVTNEFMVTVRAPLTEPVVLNIALNESNVVLDWGTVPGCRYTLETTDDLLGQQWDPVQAESEATNSTMSVTLPFSDAALRAFRVRARE